MRRAGPVVALVTCSIPYSLSASIDVVEHLPVASYCGFFFQAEVGIRGRDVPGVQTCALPIFRAAFFAALVAGSIHAFITVQLRGNQIVKIGRASCRERV